MYNQRGYCKFGDKCFQRHEKEICHDRNECTNQYCSKRHPRECRYFIQFGRCKFGVGCAFSHDNNNKSHKAEELNKEVEEMKAGVKKVEQLEKEVHELKAEVKNIKQDIKLMKKAPELTLSNVKGEKLEKGVTELKEEVSTLKQMFAKMYKLIQSRNKVEPEMKENENEKDNEKEEVLEKNEESSERSKGRQGKFKCDKCEYETIKKATLDKHINTKHGLTCGK